MPTRPIRRSAASSNNSSRPALSPAGLLVRTIATVTIWTEQMFCYTDMLFFRRRSARRQVDTPGGRGRQGEISVQIPALTAGYLGVLALLYAVLSIRVVLLRGRYRVSLGDGGSAELTSAIRAHAHFAE